MPPLHVLAEIVGRVCVVFVAVLVLLRLAGRKELASLSPIELLTMLLISETVSPALTGGDNSLVGGLLAASTLVGLTTLLGWASFRWRGIERAIDGQSKVLIARGRVQEAVLRAERLTDDELRTALHQHGLLAVAEVAFAFIEPDGKITMIAKRDHDELQHRAGHGGRGRGVVRETPEAPPAPGA